MSRTRLVQWLLLALLVLGAIGATAGTTDVSADRTTEIEVSVQNESTQQNESESITESSEQQVDAGIMKAWIHGDHLR